MTFQFQSETTKMSKETKQYIVQMYLGAYGDSTNASLVFFVLTEEPCTPTEIASLFRDVIIAASENNKQKTEEYFLEMFHAYAHETDEFGFQLLEVNGFHMTPHEGVPIDGHVTLSNIDKWINPKNDYYWFQPENLVNEQVSKSIFSFMEFT